jgi:hypothetical protein
MDTIEIKLKDKIIILIFIILLCVALVAIFYKEAPIYNDNYNIRKQLELIDSINVKLDILNKKNNKLDTLISNKITHNYYEQIIFMDSTIISNDSIDKFISTYLKSQ